MMSKLIICAVLAFLINNVSFAFMTPRTVAIRSVAPVNIISQLYMSGEGGQPTTTISDPMDDAMDEMDDATRVMMEKQRRTQELREQEVFMKLSTGKHKCSNCDWEYDEVKGDSMMIGGMIKPGTKFDDMPSDWRCPVCRASKDAFVEIVEEIPGFEVNQGYGFGTNSWSAGQKNLAIFGGLAAFFILFLSGYAMS
ncbi:MAG: rubredoxin [Bacillariaceae sp.]|jgi:rubredoxin